MDHGSHRDASAPASAPSTLELATQVLDGVTDGVLFVDRDWHVRWVNAHAHAMLGHRADTLIGKPLWDALPADVGNSLRAAFELALRDGESPPLDEAFVAGRWLEPRVHRSRDGLVIFFRDVTQRREARETRERDDAKRKEAMQARDEAERLAHLGFWRWDIADNRVHWSEQLYRIYGIDEGVGVFGASFEGYLARVHPGDRDHVRATIGKALEGTDTFGFEERIVRPSGEVRHLRSWGRVNRDDEGRPLSMFGTCLDMTQLIVATDALRRSEEWLEIALRAARLGLWDWHMRANTVTWSDGVERVFGMAPGTFAGTYDAYLACLHPDDRGRVDAAIRQAVVTGDDYEIEHRVLWPDGSIRWLAGRGRVFRDEQGNPVRMAGSVLDVTDRRRAEEERRKFVLLVENALDFVGLASVDGRLLYLNEAGRRMVGIGSLEEALTKRVGDLLTPEGLHESLEVELPSVLATGRWEGEGQLVNLETRARIDVLVNSFVVRDPSSDPPVCFATVRRDVTARLMLERQVRQSQKMDALGRLAAGVAHDFNNLLTIVSGMAELALRDPASSEGVRGYLREIDAAGQRAAMLTRQLLGLSRHDSFTPVVLDLNDVVADGARLFVRLLPPDIAVEVELAKVAPRVRADLGQLEQVLLNLVVNARDAMPTGGRLSITTGAEDGFATIAVSDTGAGMSDDVRAHVFEPFFTTKGPDRGTGLGLSTVDAIVSRASGDVRVATALGKGTTFTVRLPRTSEPITRRPPSRGATAAAPSKAVLLVEDQEAVRATIRQGLEAEGYRVLDTGSGENALRMFRAHGSEIALLVADVRMPGMPGPELAEQMRSLDAGLKVLFITGSIETDTIGSSRDPVLQKPFRASDLAARIREVLAAEPTA